MQRASKSVLLVPGEDVIGDGIVLVLHGYIVELVEPTVMARAEVNVLARVRGLCGCPFTSGGMWDADSLRVRALVYHGTTIVKEVLLVHTGEPSLFGGTVSLEDAQLFTTRLKEFDQLVARELQLNNRTVDARRGQLAATM